MLLYFLTHCLCFNLVVMFGSRRSSGLSGRCGAIQMQSVREERKAYESSFQCIVQMWAQKQMLFILLYGFLLEFLELYCSTTIFNSRVTTLAVSAITCKSPGSADAWNAIRFGRRCVWCVLSYVHLPVWLQGETVWNETSWNWCYNQTLTNIDRKTLLLRVTVTLKMGLMASLTQTSHSGLIIQTGSPHQ